MKRIVAWVELMALLLTLTACSACGTEETPPMSDGGATAVSRRLGMDSVSSVAMEGADKTHLTVTVAAIVLDGNGKIADCAVDELAFSVTLNKGLPQEVDNLLSYLDMPEDHKPADSTRSWREQVEAFCDYVEGKTPDGLAGLATTDGKSEEIEGCDLVVTDFIRAITGAAKSAKVQKLAAGDDLEVALTAAKAEGYSPQKPQYDVEIAAVTVGAGDRITGCITDTLQAKLTVVEGAFSSLTGGLKTKRQEGDGYGMKPASSIEREWYEQADAFATYTLGKTAQELAGTKLNSEGKTDAITGCTVAVTGMLKNAVKAANKD